jgi:hypothetical protein
MDILAQGGDIYRAIGSLTPLPTPFIVNYCSLEIYASVRTSAGLRGIG